MLHMTSAFLAPPPPTPHPSGTKNGPKPNQIIRNQKTNLGGRIWQREGAVTDRVSVPIGAYLKKVWCSMQTFHSRFEARWLGSLKPMVLSNCSYLSVEVEEEVVQEEEEVGVG